MAWIELVRLLKRRIAIIIALPIVFGVATAVLCWGFMPDRYASDVSLYITSAGENANAAATEQEKKVAEDVLLIACKEQIKENTAKALQLATLSGYKVEVSSSATSRMLTVKVEGKDPESVALIADAMAIQICDAVSDVMSLDTLKIANTAAVPQAPIGPARVKYTALAVLAGLVLGFVVVLLMQALNMSVRSKREAEALLGIPVVGRMPYVKDLE